MKLNQIHEALKQSRINTDPAANVSVLFQLSKLQTKIFVLENKMIELERENKKLKSAILQEMSVNRKNSRNTNYAISRNQDNIKSMVQNEVKNK